MKYDKIKVEAGRAWPVNPIDFVDHFGINEELRQAYIAFETWLSTQPEIHTSAPDGVYNVDEFEPVVWQYADIDCDNWVSVLPEAYTRLNNDYSKFVESNDGYFETRQWLELKPAGESMTKGYSPTVGWVTKEAVNNSVIWALMEKKDFHISDEQPDKVGEETYTKNQVAFLIQHVKQQCAELSAIGSSFTEIINTAFDIDELTNHPHYPTL